ncbi:MAG: hypothetical protein MJZ19_08490 [Paludibacteraceae bacterium]|nr:hypothetical protein [Paludibacteraceae bacterium]
MQNILLYTIIGAVAMIAISYGKTAKGLTDLALSLYSLKVHSFKSGQLILRLSLRIVNTGSSDVVFNNISGKVLENGSLIGTFNKLPKVDKWVCPGKGAVTLINDIEIKCEIVDTVKRLLSLVTGQSLNLTISGDMISNGNTLPFSFDKKITL